MTSQQSPSSPAAPGEADEPIRGSPRPHATWSVRQTIAAFGVAAVIAALGGAAIYAATTDGSGPFAWGMHAGPGRPGRGGLGGLGQGRIQGPNPVAGTNTLHGEFVVSDGKGGYTTSLTQTGTLTAVSETSVTAKSADGYTKTYVLTSSHGRFAVNDVVTIEATLADGVATVTGLADAKAATEGG
jgi:hypothetical protein